jgi:hypothetical protein
MSDSKLIWSNLLSKLDLFNGKVSAVNNIFIDSMNRIFIYNDRGIIKIRFNELITDCKIIENFIAVSTIDSWVPN